MTTKNNATIADVARHAGVSTATVSRLLNGIGPVSDQTERRVRRAILDLKYTPKRKRRSQGTLAGPGGKGGGLLPPIAFVRTGVFPGQNQSPVTEHLVEALHRTANALGRTLTVHHIPDLESCQVHQVIGDAKGVLLRSSIARGVTREAFAWLKGIPAVQVLGENRNQRLWLDHVTPDNTQAGILAAEHLIGLGCEELVFASPTQTQGVGMERCIAFVRTASDAGKTVRVLLQAKKGASRNYEQELEGLSANCKVLETRMDLLREIAGIRGRPFGLFIPTDLELAMIMPQLQMLDLRMGKDAHAIGCDHEIRCFTGLDPLPATMDLHLENIALRSVRRLLYRMEHPTEPLVRISVAPSVITSGEVLSQQDSLEFDYGDAISRDDV
ncbi:MAG: LacI family DNA-binding transcriptional regulator [Verrucomicrobia bacterium]|nr:LacI family DNA-binding transcriptional regulator [Verrucomicrobiota bacterium]MCH8526842.1 LacI family transcriptional regulator [Kiritimatiellia bacterium]